MAAQQALEGEPAAFEDAVLADGFVCVLAAGGSIAAMIAQIGRYAHLVEADELQCGPR